MRFSPASPDGSRSTMRQISGISVSTADIQKSWCRGGSVLTSNLSGTSWQQTKRTPFPNRTEKLYRRLFEAGTDAGSMGLFCLVAATGEGFRATVANEADGAGAVDRRREVVRKRTRRADETGRDRCHSCCVEGHRPLDSGGKTEGNNRRAG